MELDFEGLELSDDQKAALNAQANKGLEGTVSAKDFDAVKANHDKLLDQRKADQVKAKEADDEKERIRLEAAAKDGDVASLQEVIEQQKQQFTDLQNGILKRDEDSAKNAFIDGILEKHSLKDPASKMYLKNQLLAGVGFKDGHVMPVNGEGALSGATLGEFVDSVVCDPDNSAYILASNASGSGAAGGQSNSQGSAQESEKTAAQILYN